MTRKFFYACSCVFMLVMACHFGADVAQGQSALRVTAAWPSRTFAACVVDRECYVNGTRLPVPIPGSSPVVAVRSYDSTIEVCGVVLDNGDWYNYSTFPAPYWRYEGNLLGNAAVPARSVTFGQMKVGTR